MYLLDLPVRVCLRVIDQSCLLSEVHCACARLIYSKQMPPKILPPPDQTVSLLNRYGITLGKGGLNQMFIVVGRN